MRGPKEGIAVCVLLLLASVARGGPVATGEVLRLSVELSDGSRIVGTPAISSVPLQTSFAKRDIPFERISGFSMGSNQTDVILSFLKLGS